MSNPEGTSGLVNVVSRSRLECLFDGIFAIAMTVLVLELKVPNLTDPSSVGELFRGLDYVWPTFGSYLLSFAMLGMFWFRHNQQYHHFLAITRTMLAFQLLQLALAAFFPFCAALFQRYPKNALAQVMYLGCVAGYLWAALGNWTYAHKHQALKPEVTKTDFLRLRNRLRRSCLVVTVIMVFMAARLTPRGRFLLF